MHDVLQLILQRKRNFGKNSEVSARMSCINTSFCPAHYSMLYPVHRLPFRLAFVPAPTFSAIVALILFCAVPSITRAQHQPERYQKVIIQSDDTDRLQRLTSFDAHTIHPIQGKGIELILSESDVQTLHEEGFKLTLVIDDLQQYYVNRAKAVVQNSQTGLQKSAQSDAPKHFKIGSAIGFYTIEELTDELERMHELYPALTSEPISIGQSVEGRDILAVRISAQPESEDVHEALFTGMHHAREPMSMMCLAYGMWHILEGYGIDDEITDLLHNRALWFVPLVNPDGYQYNLSYFPEGGGMWRKNRGGIDQQGVDLNRNYSNATQWGPAETPNLIDPASGNYRGSAPFSEPETRAIRDFARARNFRTALNYHSLSNVLIYHAEGSIPQIADTALYTLAARELTLGEWVWAWAWCRSHWIRGPWHCRRMDVCTEAIG